jgi:adenylyltransferase/sulfurtransferase
MDLSDEQLERYARHIILKEVGGAGQARLLRARVAIIGAGGLGSPLLMYLAAAGVGTLGLIDDDVVSLSNLQRQIVHASDRIGRTKTASAREAIAAINPDITLECHEVRLTADNAGELLAGYDIIADGSDNFATRLAVSDACVALKTTLVSGAIAGFEGQLATFKPHAADDDAGLPCYRCFLPRHPGEAAERSCSDQGILGAVAGVVGTMQAVEVLKELLDLGNSLAGQLMLYDSLSARSRLIRLPKDPACTSCGNGKA